MLSLDKLFKKASEKLKVYKSFMFKADRDITNKLTICIPDIHLLERGPNDDFLDNKPEYEDRFLRFLDFLLILREEESDDLEIIQLGDMYELWQAKGNTNLIQEAYPDILGLLDKIGTTYVVGNHDIDLIKWYEDASEKFGRKLRHFSITNRESRAMYEHGFQADFANNQESWAGVLGRGVTKLVGIMEDVYPDIDIVLGSAWSSIEKVFSKYNNNFTPVKNPRGFDSHKYTEHYVEQLEKWNRGVLSEKLEKIGVDKIDLCLAVIGHTHRPRLVSNDKNGELYYLMDCGSWVNGGHEIGIITGRDIAVCQWE